MPGRAQSRAATHLPPCARPPDGRDRPVDPRRPACGSYAAASGAVPPASTRSHSVHWLRFGPEPPSAREALHQDPTPREGASPSSASSRPYVRPALDRGLRHATPSPSSTRSVAPKRLPPRPVFTVAAINRDKSGVSPSRRGEPHRPAPVYCHDARATVVSA